MDDTNAHNRVINVLLAASDDAQITQISAMLEEAGYCVTVTTDVTATVAHYRQENPDVVIVDTNNLHDGNPLAACAQIRARRGSGQVVLLAIIPNDPDALRHALAAGVDDCLVHPVHDALLLRRLDNLLGIRLAQHSGRGSGLPSSEGEARYQQLFDAATDAIFIVDPAADTILDVNRRAVRWLGYNRDDLLQTFYSTLEVTHDPGINDSALMQEMSSSGYFVYEAGYRASNGQVIPGEVSSRLFVYQGRRALLNFVRDVSRRHEIEQAEREQRRLAEALRDTAAAINSTLKLDEVVARVLTNITRIIPAETANLMLIEDGVGRVFGHRGYEAINVSPAWLQRDWAIDDYPNLQKVVSTRRPSVIYDVRSAELWREKGDTAWLRSCITAPIILNDEVIGLLNVDHRLPNQFTEAHGEHLLAFTNQASIAIQNARLHEAAQRHVDELEARVSQRTAELSRANETLRQQIAERQRAEQELAEERNLLRTLLDNIPDEIYVKDRSGRVVMANRALTERMDPHAPNGSVIGSTDFDYDYLSSEQVQSVYETEQALMRGDIPIINTQHNMHTEGDHIWQLTTKVPLYNHHEEIIGLVGINRDVTALSEAEERLNHVITGANCLLWSAIARDDGERLRLSIEISSVEAAQNFLPLELEPGENYTRAWTRSILAEDKQRLNDKSTQAVRSGASTYQQEFRAYRADGAIRWLHEEVKVTPLSDNRYSLVGVCTDITERKAAEQTLRRANEQLERRVDVRTRELKQANTVLREQIAVRQRAEEAEREQRILAEALSASAAALTQTLEITEVLDRVLMHAMRVVPEHETSNIMLLDDGGATVRVLRVRSSPDCPTDERELLREGNISLDHMPNLRHVIKTDQPVITTDTATDTLWVTWPGREWIRSHISVPIHAEGRVIGFINLGSATTGQFQPIHAQRLLAFCNQAGIAIQNARLFQAVRKHASDLSQRVAERTAELEQERGLLRAILDAMTEGVIYYDRNGSIQFVNQPLVRLTGYPIEEWLRSQWQSLLVDENDPVIVETLNDLQERVRRHGIWHNEIRARRKDGTTFDARLVTTQVPSADQRPAGGVVVLRDVSAAKRLEEQKARFIATASHELRTPVTNMKTRLYLIKRQPENLESHLEVLSTVTDRMRQLIEDLLDVSRFEHGVITLNWQPVNLQELVQSVVIIQRPEAENRELQLTTRTDSMPLVIQADPSRLAQVVTNLVTNAINYTPSGGQVMISASRQQRRFKNRVETWALVEVRDTGIGIPADMQGDVFKPFFRVSDYSAGVGLGLSISREIVEMHGGQIELESAQDEGTTFSVWLPLNED